MGGSGPRRSRAVRNSISSGVRSVTGKLRQERVGVAIAR